jgi:hypothetical protein
MTGDTTEEEEEEENALNLYTRNSHELQEFQGYKKYLPPMGTFDNPGQKSRTKMIRHMGSRKFTSRKTRMLGDDSGERSDPVGDIDKATRANNLFRLQTFAREMEGRDLSQKKRRAENGEDGWGEVKMART